MVVCVCVVSDKSDGDDAGHVRRSTKSRLKRFVDDDDDSDSG